MLTLKPPLQNAGDDVSADEEPPEDEGRALRYQIRRRILHIIRIISPRLVEGLLLVEEVAYSR